MHQNIYGIAQDILMPIFSGLRPQKNIAGEFINEIFVYQNLYYNFIHPSLNGICHLFIDILQILLEKMHADDPQQRGTLAEARQTLEDLKELIIPNTLNIDPLKLERYQKQLQVLERFIV